MSPVEVAMVVRRRLAAELRDERALIDGLASAVERLLEPASDARDEWMRALALAFALERFYTPVESLVGRALRTLDGDVPSGPSWHLELLRAASVDVPDCRPAILSREAADELRELLTFRHLARHGYEREPELLRLLDHAARAGRAHRALASSLDALDRWLLT